MNRLLNSFKKHVEVLRVVEDYQTAFEVLIEQYNKSNPTVKINVPVRGPRKQLHTTDMDGFRIGSFEHPMDDYGMSDVGGHNVKPIGEDDGKE